MYWVLALVLTAFGFVTGFSIGAPFLLIGVTLLALGPFRRWPRLFRPVLARVITFVVVVVLLVPLTCVATSDRAGASQTVCSSILGPTWSGTGLYNPPPEAFTIPAQLGTVAGLAVAAATVVWLTIRRGRERAA
jgi:hypothetical protein